MKKIVFLSLMVAGGFAFMLNSSTLTAAGSYKFGDVTFAKKLCKAWNNSSMPKRLGTKAVGGTGWINYFTGETKSAPKKGFQKIVSGRRDCKGWPKFQIVLEQDASGKAICNVAKSGKYDGKNLTWQFIPKTEHWFNFARSFGMFDFAKLMNGFKGPMMFAKKNQSNFQIFWRLGAKLGLNSDWKTGCKGIDVEDVQDEIDDYKKKFKL